jgi:hypothetical protein
MSRLAFRGAVGVLAAALATACLGGQTGQPSSDDVSQCEAIQLSPTAAWGGTTVEAAVHTFEGTYSSGLQWQAESRVATAPSLIELEDGAQLSVSYGGEQAQRDCGGQLIAPVVVTLTTTHSGLVDSGVGKLTLVRSSQALVGSLHYESKLVRLDAALDEAAAAMPPRGGFDALDSSLPGASATFTEAP